MIDVYHIHAAILLTHLCIIGLRSSLYFIVLHLKYRSLWSKCSWSKAISETFCFTYGILLTQITKAYFPLAVLVVVSIHAHNLCFIWWGFKILGWHHPKITKVMTFRYFCSRPSLEEQHTHCQDQKSCDVLWPRRAFNHTQSLQNMQLYYSNSLNH